MDWIQVFTIIGTLTAIIGTLGAFTFWSFNKLDTDIKGVGYHISDVNNRLDGWIKHSIAVQAEQSKRTDQLYQMFIDLLKERK